MQINFNFNINFFPQISIVICAVIITIIARMLVFTWIGDRDIVLLKGHLKLLTAIFAAIINLIMIVTLTRVHICCISSPKFYILGMVHVILYQPYYTWTIFVICTLCIIKCTICEMYASFWGTILLCIVQLYCTKSRINFSNDVTEANSTKIIWEYKLPGLQSSSMLVS